MCEKETCDMPILKGKSRFFRIVSTASLLTKLTPVEEGRQVYHFYHPKSQDKANPKREHVVMFFSHSILQLWLSHPMKNHCPSRAFGPWLTMPTFESIQSPSASTASGMIFATASREPTSSQHCFLELSSAKWHMGHSVVVVTNGPGSKQLRLCRRQWQMLISSHWKRQCSTTDMVTLGKSLKNLKISRNSGLWLLYLSLFLNDTAKFFCDHMKSSNWKNIIIEIICDRPFNLQCIELI